MSQITELNKKLENNPKQYIDVYDPSKRQWIERNMNIDAILQNYSSVMDYYKSFLAKGFNELGIVIKRKNGTSYVNKQLPVIIKLQEKETPAQNYQTPSSQPKQASNNMPIDSLGAGVKNLTLDKYIDLNFTEKEHAKLVKEHVKLEEKYTSEKKKRKKYQKLFEEVSTKSFIETPTGQKAIGLVETLGMAFIEKTTSASALANGKQQPVINGLDGLSETKKAFVNEILKSPKLTDEVLQNLSLTAVGLSNSEAFISALDLLLQEYELIPN